MGDSPGRDRLTLGFEDAELERRFQVATGTTFAPQFRLGLSVGAALWVVAGFLLPRFSPVDDVRAGVLAALMTSLNLGALVLSRRFATLDAQHALGTVVNVLAGLAVLWIAVDAGAVERYAAPALMLISIFAFVVLRFRFVAAAAAATVYLAAFAAVVVAHHSPATLVIDAFLLVSAVISAVVATYLLEAAERDLFRQRERIAEQEAALRVEKAKSDRLLRSILPEPIVDQLREDQHAVAQKFDAATIVFADLVGFTPLVERFAPEVTAEMLNELYSEFDEAAHRHGIEKIKTIGDAYMAASGVPEPCADHANRAAAFALDLLEIVRVRAARTGAQLAVRIGIHSGPVVAGVIGKTKFSYDLWGDTVNVASRFESHGVVGAVQVSGATASLLGDRFEVTSRGEIELKGRGAMAAYLIQRRS